MFITNARTDELNYGGLKVPTPNQPARYEFVDTEHMPVDVDQIDVAVRHLIHSAWQNTQDNN